MLDSKPIKPEARPLCGPTQGRELSRFLIAGAALIVLFTLTLTLALQFASDTSLGFSIAFGIALGIELIVFCVQAYPHKQNNQAIKKQNKRDLKVYKKNMQEWLSSLTSEEKAQALKKS